MERRELNKEIIYLAAPAIINNITVPLLGLSDTAISGHLGSSAYLGAIAVGTMMLNVVFWLSGFLRMGTTGLTARSYGKGSVADVREVLKKSFIILTVISCLVILLRGPLRELLLYAISPDQNVTMLASDYFDICVWGVPAQLILMTVSGWFIGLQNTVVPMGVAIITNIINILLSVFLAFGLRYGFEGVAFGTLIANWIGALGLVIYTFFKKNKIRENIERNDKTGEERRELIQGKIRWSELFSVNAALFIRSGCIMAVTVTVTSIGARLGETTLAANAVMMQFFIFFSYFMDGFAFSGEALVGRYSGAGNKAMVNKTMRALVKWGVGMALLFFLIYLFGYNFISSLLTDSREVLEVIEKNSVWIILLPPVTVSAFIFDGIFIGMTKTTSMMAVTLLGAGIFFGLLFLSGHKIDNGLLWISFESYLLTRGLFLALIYLLRIEKTIPRPTKKR